MSRILIFFCLIGFIVFPLLGKPLKANQSTICDKELRQISTVSFVSEPVWMAHCPAVETWFQGSESLFENFIFQRNTSSQRAAAWRHEAPSVAPDDETTWVLDSISPCIYLRLSKCLPVHLSCFPLYFLIVLISRKTHEYQQPLRNLMDLEWTWELKKTLQQFKYLIIRGFIWMKLSWLQCFCSYTLAWLWRSWSFCAEIMMSLNKTMVFCPKSQSTSWSKSLIEEKSSTHITIFLFLLFYFIINSISLFYRLF